MGMTELVIVWGLQGSRKVSEGVSFARCRVGGCRDKMCRLS